MKNSREINTANDELTELVDEQVYSWLEVHKKSALSYLILKALDEKDRWSRELTEWIITKTDWTITEKGLYRLLRRMHNSGSVNFKQVTVKRTGAKRKVFYITSQGKALLSGIEKELQYINTNR